jgi:hypothetical protein
MTTAYIEPRGDPIDDYGVEDQTTSSPASRRSARQLSGRRRTAILPMSLASGFWTTRRRLTAGAHVGRGSDEQTDNLKYADDRNFYKVEK